MVLCIKCIDSKELDQFWQNVAWKCRGNIFAYDIFDSVVCALAEPNNSPKAVFCIECFACWYHRMVEDRNHVANFMLKVKTARTLK